jgi:hypothetical protein
MLKTRGKKRGGKKNTCFVVNGRSCLSLVRRDANITARSVALTASFLEGEWGKGGPRTFSPCVMENTQWLQCIPHAVSACNAKLEDLRPQMAKVQELVDGFSEALRRHSFPANDDLLQGSCEEYVMQMVCKREKLAEMEETLTSASAGEASLLLKWLQNGLLADPQRREGAFAELEGYLDEDSKLRNVIAITKVFWEWLEDRRGAVPDACSLDWQLRLIHFLLSEEVDVESVWLSFCESISTWETTPECWRTRRRRARELHRGTSKIPTSQSSSDAFIPVKGKSLRSKASSKPSVRRTVK